MFKRPVTYFPDGKDDTLFLRGTCVEEAVYIMSGGKKTYKKPPSGILAWPIPEGFKKANISPNPEIPEFYNLERVLNESIRWACSTCEHKSKLMTGAIGSEAQDYDYYYFKQFSRKKRDRSGVVIGFNEKILDLKWSLDKYFSMDSGHMYAIHIPLNDNPQPKIVSKIIFLTPADRKEFGKHSSKNIKLSQPLFNHPLKCVEYSEKEERLHKDCINLVDRKIEFGNFPIYYDD